MSIVEVVDWGARPGGATALAGSLVGGIEKNQVARMPAPEMTAVDFQSMRRNHDYSNICHASPCGESVAFTRPGSRFSVRVHVPVPRSCSTLSLDTNMNHEREPRTELEHEPSTQNHEA